MTTERLSKIAIPVFSTALFPPIHYMSEVYSAKDIFIEANCNYSRKTFRNRYLIMGANGVLKMSVPVVNTSGEKTKTKDIKVSYDTPWNEQHWKSIVSAYNTSPYFQYYDKEIELIFKKKWKYLLDMNMQSLQTIIECIGLKISISLTEKYTPSDVYLKDFRDIIHPKKEYNADNNFKPEPYHQVFEQKYGFIPNLSILDLLFNKGPESLIVLKKPLKNE